MKKKKRNMLLWMGIFLLLLAASYAAVLKFTKDGAEEDGQTTESGTVTLLSLPKEDIERISFENDTTSLSFKKAEDTWVYESDEELELTQSYISNMQNVFTNLTSIRTVSETEENLAEYGLETPSCRATAVLTDGSEVSLYVGDKNAVTSDYYVRADGIEGIYTVKSTIAGYFQYTLLDMVKSDTIPSVSMENLKKLQINWEGEEVILTMLESSEYDPSGMQSWFITSPFSHEFAVDSAALETQVTALSGLSFSKLADVQADEEELAQMGLKEENANRISFTYTEADTDAESRTSVYTLLIGEENGAGSYYVMEKGSGKVHLMSKSSLDSLVSAEPNSYVYRYPSLVHVDTVDRVTIREEDMIYELVIPEEEGEAGAETETNEAITSLYQVLISLTAERIIDEPEGELTYLPFEIVYYRKDADDFNVKFAEYDTSYYLVQANEDAVYLINKRDYESYKASVFDGFLKINE